MVNRFEVYLVSLDPIIGSEIKKNRPCVIISPNEINRNLRTVIIAPMTSATRNYPTRINISFQNKNGQILLDQIRTIDKERLVKKLGVISKEASDKVCLILQEMFS